MSRKFSGSVIRGVAVTTTGGSSGTASGVWGTTEATQKKAGSIWPSPKTVPGAPTSVVATGISGGASVAFTAPADTGGEPITSYTVTATPGGATATGSSSPISITGLTAGASYTFTVSATNSLGTGANSAASSSITIPQVYGFTGSTTWTVPQTGTYTLYTVGGGAGDSGTNYYGNYYGAGGGSGYYATTTASLTAGQSISINIGGGGGAGGGGGTTSIVRSGSTLLSSSGGNPGGNAYGGSGGSGGGSGPPNSPFTPNQGGYSGSNSQANTGSAGSGQLGVSFGNGTDANIPPGGNGSYAGATVSWAGILGQGSGNQASSNQSGQCSGGGAGGRPWSGGARSGASGLIVIFG